MKLSQLEKAKRQLSRVSYSVVGECHIPLRVPNKFGYVNTNFEHRQTKLHRLMAFAYLGLDITDEKQLALHKLECPNRACFRLEHIYVGNHSQNTKDTAKAGHHHEANRTTCNSGHPLDGTTYIRGEGIRRYCKECARINSRNYQRRKKIVKKIMT